MKRKILTALLVIVLICALGFASFIGYLKYSEQYNIGLSEGKSLGYDEGYNKGLEEGYTNGYLGTRTTEREDQNSTLTLKEFQNSKVVDDIELINTNKYLNEYYITMFGEVTDISGRVLTISAEGDSLSIYIDENAVIAVLAIGEEFIKDRGTYTETFTDSREVEFEELKIGERVQIAAYLRLGRSIFEIDHVAL